MLTKFVTTIAQNVQQVFNAGYEQGKSECAVTLFTPSISLQSVTSVLTITDNRNGDFAQGYNVYANDNLITVLTSKEVTLNDYIEHTETIDIKVQAVGANFNPSDYAVATWEYVNVAGTAGLAYAIGSNGTTSYCKGIGNAVVTDIEIASMYEGLPVSTIGYRSFRSCSSLTSVVIPDSVISILGEAFNSCVNLKSVVVGGSVETIADLAFNSSGKLKRVDFSKHTIVPTLGINVFGSTNANLQIKVPASLIDEWKNASNWCDIASKIVTEFTNEV